MRKSRNIGVIKKIKKDENGTPLFITIVFNGYVEFTPETESAIDILASYDPVTITKTTNLESGVVYFLGKNGLLHENDPASSGGDGNSNVSNLC